MYRLVACCLAILLFVAPPILAQDAPIRVSSGVMAGQLLTKVAPVYPPEAKDAKVMGSVVMHAIIGKNGLVESLDIVSGPELLRRPALDAVQQWTYKPYLLNGNPVAVETSIAVSYSSGRLASADNPGTPIATPALPPLPPGRIRVSSGVMNGLAKTQKMPKYPEPSAAAHESGTVVLHAVIDKSGKVIQLDVLYGPKILSQAVMDAVWQWTYKPYLLNGEPVEVETQITINISHGG
jgi:TonB family protein